MGLGGIPQPKPARGSGRKAIRSRRAKVESHEQALKRQSKALDGFKCRVPKCPFRVQRDALHSAHRVHKGIGGDPAGTRTCLEDLVTLCPIHHGQYDGKLGGQQLEIRYLDRTKRFRGPCVFYGREGDKWVQMGVERDVGVVIGATV